MTDISSIFRIELGCPGFPESVPTGTQSRSLQKLRLLKVRSREIVSWSALYKTEPGSGSEGMPFEEIKGKPPAHSDIELDKAGDVSHRVFFVVAPDGLCYMIGERQE
jgi:hypothetical protein